MTGSRAALGAIMCLLFVLSGRLALASPGNVLLARNRTEPVVAINPARPSTIVVASNTNYQQSVGGTYPTAYYTSHDGGRSFAFGNIPMVYPFTTGADPALATVNNGTLFYSYLGETQGYCSGGRSAVLLTSSFDVGDHFRMPTIVDVDPADDKPALAVRSGRPGRAHIYLTWTRWHNSDSEIWYARSLNGGFSFSRPVELFRSRLDNFGSVPIVGPHGRLYVFWSAFPEKSLTAVSPTRILMRASSNDGASFGPAHPVTSTFQSVPRMATPGALRNLPGPAVATASRGALFLAWSAVTAHRGDNSVTANIDISKSSNEGRSWTKPQPVNDASRGDRFMPSISLMRDGSLALAFYDRRNSPWQLDMYAAHVGFANGFHRAPNVRVDAGASPISDIYYIAPGSTCFSPGRFFGDYIGTAVSSDDQLCVVWADTQMQVPQETEIWFAKIKLPSTVTQSMKRGGRSRTRATMSEHSPDQRDRTTLTTP